MKRLIIILALFVFVLSSCAAAKSTESAGAPSVAPSAPRESASSGASYDAVTSNVSKPGSAGQRIVIKNANLSLVVLDPADVMNKITGLTEGLGGFVVESNLYKTTTSQGLEVPAAYLTIRVPAEQLDSVLTQIKSWVEDPKTDILSETVSGQDVTSEYTDLQSCLKNLEAAEKQLSSIMDSATKIEDVMTVYNQLTSVRSDIEVLKGQIKYYDESARLSAITINLTAKASIQPVEIGGWKPVGIARDAVQALIDGLKVIGTILIWGIIFVLPIGLIIGIPIWLITRAVRKNKAKHPEKTDKIGPQGPLPDIK